MRRRRSLWIISLMVLLAVVAAACGQKSSSPPPVSGQGPVYGIAVGLAAPDFILKQLDGQEVELNELKGQPVFLNFWTTGCPTCREEMPVIQAAYMEGKDKYHFLLVDVQESESTVKDFLAKNGYTMK